MIRHEKHHVKLNPPPEYTAVLTKHEDDLYPVCAFRMPGNVWLRQIEGPEDICDRPGDYALLFRPPTYWIEINEICNSK